MTGKGELEIVILGCGSSGGVPRGDGDWGDCDPNEPKNRRTRCSMLARRQGPDGATSVLIDTSPDLREQIEMHHDEDGRRSNVEALQRQFDRQDRHLHWLFQEQHAMRRRPDDGRERQHDGDEEEPLRRLALS